MGFSGSILCHLFILKPEYLERGTLTMFQMSSGHPMDVHGRVVKYMREDHQTNQTKSQNKTGAKTQICCRFASKRTIYSETPCPVSYCTLIHPDLTCLEALFLHIKRTSRMSCKFYVPLLLLSFFKIFAKFWKKYNASTTTQLAQYVAASLVEYGRSVVFLTTFSTAVQWLPCAGKAILHAKKMPKWLFFTSGAISGSFSSLLLRENRGVDIAMFLLPRSLLCLLPKANRLALGKLWMAMSCAWLLAIQTQKKSLIGRLFGILNLIN